MQISLFQIFYIFIFVIFQLNRLQSQQSLNDSENSHDENKKPPESRHHNWQQLTTDPVLWLDRLSAIFRSSIFPPSLNLLQQRI